MTEFFVRPGKTEDAVNAAEGPLAFHTVKHHNSYKSMDCTSALPKKAFPDTDTTKKFSGERYFVKAGFSNTEEVLFLSLFNSRYF